MAIKKQKINKAIILCGIMLAFNVNAQIKFPDIPYTSAHMQANNCDPTVYQHMYNKAKAEFEARQPAMQDVLVKQQLEAQPKTATNAALRCVEGAINQIKSITSTIDSLLGMITGSGNIDWSALGASAINQLGNMACNQINNYTNGIMYSATSPYTSTINQGVGALNSAGVNTPVGTLNVGGQVWNAAQTGTPTGTGVLSTGVNNAVGGINNAANTATGAVKDATGGILK